MRSSALAALLVATSAFAPQGIAEAGTTPPSGAQPCSTLLAPKPASLTPFTVSGQTVQLRDPYGGQVSRNRLFVSFGLSYPTAAARAAVQSVAWQVDGEPFPANGSGPTRYLNFSSLRLSVGPHVVTAIVTPADGSAAVEAQTTVTATDCQAATIFPDLSNGKTRQPATIQIAGGGPTMTSVMLSATGLRAAVPASLAGRKVGTLKLSSIDGPDINATLKTYTLRAPAKLGARSLTLLSQAGLTARLRPGTTGVLITLNGLPETTQAITITTRTGVLSVAKPCPLPTLGARLTSLTGSPIVITTGIDISRSC
jgi:hypothetical protein